MKLPYDPANNTIFSGAWRCYECNFLVPEANPGIIYDRCCMFPEHRTMGTVMDPDVTVLAES